MTEDDRAYATDLIHTAEHLYRQAVALLVEAARIAGGEARDAVPIVYFDGTHYTPPTLEGGDVNPEPIRIGDYLVPTDPYELVGECESCQ